jgi:mediator of RNA polymerase II transcription subunit 31
MDIPPYSVKDTIPNQDIPLGDITENTDAHRFILELEFIQLLSNPEYILFLGQSGLFDKKEFLNYLDYLKYWKKPIYANYVKFPFSLFILDCLTQSDAFRKGE